jgi:hypothetical protein
MEPLKQKTWKKKLYWVLLANTITLRFFLSYEIILLNYALLRIILIILCFFIVVWAWENKIKTLILYLVITKLRGGMS